jgi:hypothetical protein
MSRRAFLRTLAGLDNAQTSRLTSSDSLLCQVNGETILRRVAANLAVPDGSIGLDQLASAVADQLMTRANIGALAQLAATPSDTDRLLIDDISQSELKWIAVGDLLPEDPPDAWASGSRDTGGSTLYGTFSNHYTITVSVPVAGNYLIIATVNGSATAGTGGLVYLEARLEDFNGVNSFADPVRLAGADGRDTSRIATGSATMMRVCTVASSGSKTAYIQGRHVVEVTPITSASFAGGSWQVALLN